MPKLELYYLPFCPFAERVFAFINENNIDNIIYKDINEQENYDYLIEHGKSSTTPCLFIDGKALYESALIIEYLQQNFT